MNNKLSDDDLVVQIIDYIANPSILRKSYTIVKGLQNYFKKIADDIDLLNKIQTKLQQLAEYSYNFEVNDYTGEQKLEIKELENFFNKQVEVAKDT